MLVSDPKRNRIENLQNRIRSGLKKSESAHSNAHKYNSPGWSSFLRAEIG